MGRGTAYKITEDNLRKVYEAMEMIPDQTEQEVTGISGMELAKKFYEEYGLPMIRAKFPEHEHKIAVGFVGEGSERFGFDDAYSRDHDFGPGFCLWVTEETYDEIGKDLQQEYDRLPTTYRGITRFNTTMAEGRVGVEQIGDFYEKYTGLSPIM